jgi:hypothetical protein
MPGKAQAWRANLGHGRPLTGKAQAWRANLGHGRSLTGKAQAWRRMPRLRSWTNGLRLDGRTAQA